MTVDNFRLKVGQKINGFTVKKVTPLKDILAFAYQLYHNKSGARLLYLSADDKENLFSIAFKTPPPDNTGLPHILEHTVLCGSKKYPVKDPFVELLKTSLATFLNAMTYSDKTVYPCASMNRQDFYNIMRVYCDAVFSPRLTKMHFKQEGHHFDFKKGKHNPKLTINGIVYNEMKGVYSELDGIIEEERSNSIFPNNAYGRNSGGDPEFIPELTYEQFVNFHKTYYHPSNSYIFVYGSFPIINILKILDEEYLLDFSKILVDPIINEQQRWSSPVRKTIPYPTAKNEDSAKKTAVTINFFTNNISDIFETLSMSLLEVYLLENASSPLQKALVDSKLGEALTNSGYGNDQRDTYFSVGLKGTDSEKANEILKIVQDTLKSESKNGLNKKKLDAAFHKFEIYCKEISSSYPLTLMDRVYNSWIYGGDPSSFLKLNMYLKKLRAKSKKDKRFFEKILEQNLVNNPHYSVLTFVPDNEYFIKAEEKFLKKMARLEQGATPEELRNIAIESKRLQEMQSTSNSPDALATLPRLKKSDVPKNALKLKTKINYINEIPLLSTEMFANEINYINLAFDLRSMTNDLIDYLPLYALATLKMGAAGYDYAEMAELESLTTGGISAEFLVEGRYNGSSRYCPYLLFSSKALSHNLGKMQQVLSERIKSADFSDMGRLKDIILQQRTRLKASILKSGSGYALLYSAKNLSLNHHVSERLKGLSHVRFINDIADGFDKRKDDLFDKLEKIRKLILNQNGLAVSFLGDKKVEKQNKYWTKEFLSSLDKFKIKMPSFDFCQKFAQKTGVIMPSGVAFNALTLPAVEAKHKCAPALFLLAQYLTYNYLWEEIRAKRGAYGVGASYSKLGGIFELKTYRDPFIVESYSIFDAIIFHIKNKMPKDKYFIEQLIIGSIKKLDGPIRPEEAAEVALLRFLRKIKNGDRQRFREKLLELEVKDIIDVAEEILMPAFKKASYCTISSKEKLDAANSDLSPKFDLEEL